MYTKKAFANCKNQQHVGQHLCAFKTPRPVNCSFSDPDPGSLAFVDPDPDQDPDLGRGKKPKKGKKKFGISCCEERYFLSVGLEPFPVGLEFLHRGLRRNTMQNFNLKTFFSLGH